MPKVELAAFLTTPLRAIASLWLFIALAGTGVALALRSVALVPADAGFGWMAANACVLALIVAPALYFLVLRDMRRDQQECHDLIDQAADLISTYDHNGRCVSVNHAVRGMLGYEREEFIGFGMRDLVHPDDLVKLSQPEEMARLKSMLEGKITITALRRLRRKDGSYVTVEIHVKRLPDGRIQSIKRDVSDRLKLEEALRINASVFDSSLEGIMITDADNNILDVNRSFTAITGYSREEVLGKNPRLLSSEMQDKDFYASMWRSLMQDKSWRGEIWNRHSSGELYAELLSITAVLDDAGQVRHYVAVFSDITRFKMNEAELSRIAHYDALTGIPNRILLADRMRQAIAQADREDKLLALCLIDLDGFKPVNDEFGHEMGDQVLVEIALRIGKTIRGADTVARIGGDEFVVLLPGLARKEELVATLERLLARIAEPIALRDQSVTLGASIGVCIYRQKDDNAETLIRHADQAMYVAKRAGKNRFFIFDRLQNSLESEG